MEKKLKGRFQQKIDTAKNWEKAINFVPMNGEIIVYSDLNKIKIGNGISTVNNLSFIGDNSDLTQELETKDLPMVFIEGSGISQLTSKNDIVDCKITYIHPDGK